MKKNNEKRNELLRLRYKFYRMLGFSSYDARILRNYEVNITNVIEKALKDILTVIESNKEGDNDEE